MFLIWLDFRKFLKGVKFFYMLLDGCIVVGLVVYVIDICIYVNIVIGGIV